MIAVLDKIIGQDRTFNAGGDALTNDPKLWCSQRKTATRAVSKSTVTETEEGKVLRWQEISGISNKHMANICCVC